MEIRGSLLICFFSLSLAPMVVKAKAENLATQTTATSTSPELINRKKLFFDAVDSKLKVKKILFTYDLQTNKGQSLKINNLEFDSNTIKATYQNQTLTFEWNTVFIQSGELTIIDKIGKEKFKTALSTGGQWKYEFSEEEETTIFADLTPFRFCLKNQRGENYTVICSRWYGIEKSESSYQVGPANEVAPPRAVFQQNKEKLKASYEVTPNEAVQFYANIASGDSFEFRATPRLPQILDAVEVDNKNFQLTALLPAPLNQEHQVFSGESYSELTSRIGFKKTIDVNPDYWIAKISNAKPELLLPGQDGGFFLIQYEVKKLPTENMRLSIDERALFNSYKSEDEIKIYDPQGKESVWKLSLPHQFQKNKNSYPFKIETNEYSAYLSSYRAAPGSASIRLTGVAAGSEFLVFGEGHVSYWFNDLFGWDQYFLSKQRWGLSARYFTSFVPLKQLEDGDQKLAVSQADLRYRFNPGLWERDESTGLILSTETVNIIALDIPKMGAGLFWARSMPEVFDHYFSMLPFMNYPKWVDMEYIQYFSTSNSDISIGNDFIVNFHGKVLWTPRVFGEAGFGIKNYNITNKFDGTEVQITSFYGTFGLGINF